MFFKTPLTSPPCLKGTQWVPDVFHAFSTTAFNSPFCKNTAAQSCNVAAKVRVNVDSAARCSRVSCVREALFWFPQVAPCSLPLLHWLCANDFPCVPVEMHVVVLWIRTGSFALIEDCFREESWRHIDCLLSGVFTPDTKVSPSWIIQAFVCETSCRSASLAAMSGFISVWTMSL